VQGKFRRASRLYPSVQGIEVDTDVPLDWYNSAWKSRIPIVVNGGQVPSTQTDFPFLINSTIPALIGKSTDEIRFADINKVKLDYEIPEFNSINGEIIAHTKIPLMQDSKITYLYFNNPSALNEQNPHDLWIDYAGVYHMNNTSFGVDSILDSTVNANHGSTSGAPTSVAGQVGKAYRTNGGGVITIPNSPSIDIGVGDFSIELWLETFGVVATFYGLLEKPLDAPVKGWQVMLDQRISQKTMQLKINDGVNSGFGTYGGSGGILSNNGLHSIGWRLDNENMLLRGYVDGVPGSQQGFPGITGDFSNTDTLKIGSTTSIDAIFDEIRLSKVIHTNDYFKTTFNNQSDPSTFYSILPRQDIA